MPVIATVGSRSPKTRALLVFVYAALILGSVTMVYPFWIVVAGSIAGWESLEYPLVPRFLYDEGALFEAYLWERYYSYTGTEGVGYEWKTNVPGTYGRNRNRWRLIPGVGGLLKSDTFLGQWLADEICTQSFDLFRKEYESIGSPGEWSPGIQAVVQKYFPFAEEQARALIDERKPFRLERKSFTGMLREAYGVRLNGFLDDFVRAGNPDHRSREFAQLMERYPDLSGNKTFVTIMQDYSMSRKPDLSDERILRAIHDYNQFKVTLPVTHREIYAISASRVVEGNKKYTAFLKGKYSTLDDLNETYGSQSPNWEAFFPPREDAQARGRYVEDTPLNRDYALLKTELSGEWSRPHVVEYWWSQFLSRRYGDDIEKLNDAWGVKYARFLDIPLQERAPSSGPARADWEEYVRGQLSVVFMRFDGGRELWQQFLIERLGSLQAINSELDRSWKSVSEITLPYMSEPVTLDPSDKLRLIGYPPTKRENNLLLEFTATRMPLEFIRVVTPESIYRNWLLRKYGSTDNINTVYGTSAKSTGDLYFPAPAAEWKAMLDDPGRVKWKVITRGYERAIDYLVREKRSLWNTAVYCIAVVLLSLAVNPLAAYALSRFNLPGSYNILLFLLATMAFPAEVTMIPNFLLLKGFPLLRVVLAVAGFFTGAVLSSVIFKGRRMTWAFAGGILGAVLGGTLVAGATAHMAGISGQVSLLNTFWALLLPGVASGYSIFILKGFFDSLPAELYEAGLIDGASEMRLFWQITLPMSGPVLAVIALWSFTAAYGSFMWAMIICQDPKMWTLMVHIYQLQLFYPDPNEYFAVLIIASLPTLLMFIAAQRVILKGIIIPTYK